MATNLVIYPRLNNFCMGLPCTYDPYENLGVMIRNKNLSY